MQYDIRQLSQLLASRAEEVCHWLLPHGNRNNHEWETGNILGEAGHSLKVNLGAKAGTWRDFASDSKGGDLIDLIAAVKCLPKALAVQEAKDFLGIKDNTPNFEPKSKQYLKPTRPHNLQPACPSIFDFFKKRGIGKATVQAFKIGSLQHEIRGTVICFPYILKNETCFIKFRPIQDKKAMWTSKDSLPCLFGLQLLPANARSIIICEGEIDAMSFHEVGHSAVSVPRGGGDGAKQDSWINTHWEELQLFDTIYLALDNDEQGPTRLPNILPNA